jgi:hypothetical protein
MVVLSVDRIVPSSKSTTVLWTCHPGSGPGPGDRARTGDLRREAWPPGVFVLDLDDILAESIDAASSQNDAAASLSCVSS